MSFRMKVMLATGAALILVLVLFLLQEDGREQPSEPPDPFVAGESPTDSMAETPSASDAAPVEEAEPVDSIPDPAPQSTEPSGGAVIRGHVVLAETGVGVAGAELRVTRRIGRRGPLGVAATERAGVSADDGSFTLDEPVAPAAELGLFAFSEWGVGHTILSVPEDVAEITEVVVVIETPGRLTVRVVENDGGAIPGAVVVARPQFPPFAFEGEWRQAPSFAESASDPFGFLRGVTDGVGVVTFSALPLQRRPREDAEPSATYRVWAVAPGYDTAKGEWAVATPAGAEVEIRFGVRRVRVSGRVLDPENRPMPGVVVHGGAGQSTTTDRDGTYSFDPLELEANPLRLSVFEDGYFPLTRERYLGDGDEPQRIDLHLSRTAAFAGRVVTRDGEPVPGITLSFERQRRSLRATSDSEGGFIVEEATPGSWRIGVVRSRDDWVLQSTQHIRGGDLDAEVVLIPREPGTARLHVEVVHHETRAPLTISSVLLAIVDREEARRYRPVRPTTQLGTVTAEGLAPTRWKIAVEIPDFGHAKTEFDVAPDDELVELVLPVGEPASLLCRFDLDGVDAALLPERFFFLAPDSKAYWVAEDGTRVPGFTDRCAVFDPRETTTIRMVNFTPGTPQLLHLVHESLIAETVVTFEPGESKEIVMPIVVGVPAQLLFPDPVRAGRITFETRGADGHWYDRRVRLDDDVTHYVHRFRLPPGRHEWRLRYVAGSGPEQGVLEERRGRAAAVAGETVEIEVPLR